MNRAWAPTRRLIPAGHFNYATETFHRGLVAVFWT
jgi:hypothetical protein